MWTTLARQTTLGSSACGPVSTRLPLVVIVRRVLVACTLSCRRSQFFHLHLDTAFAQLGEKLDSIFREEGERGKFVHLIGDAGLARALGREHVLALQQGFWRSLDGEESVTDLSAHHRSMALRAKDRMQRPVHFEPLTKSRLVRISGLASDDPTAGLRRTLFDDKKIIHITGLADVHFAHRLLMSLWLDAGRPTVGAATLPEQSADVPMAKWRRECHDLMMDRSNWSQHNLRTFASLFWSLSYYHEIQALLHLVQYTSGAFTPNGEVLPMPVHLLSLAECNNMKPFSRTLVPVDQLECLLHGQRHTTFHLDSKAFDSGSRFLHRDKLRKLGQGLCVSSTVGTAGTKERLTIVASPLASITFDDTSRKVHTLRSCASHSATISPSACAASAGSHACALDRTAWGHPRERSLLLLLLRRAQGRAR
jgi:hypothetical protein